eukprot:TRINITY_DN25129_c0_g1_i1.p1 TRINITY_DN25129_c0_g1~~TRINITY_DN25129_c0_g1_i1.p1  ORF type:complete len:134 (-),score=19.95 TRINITY_DN25129_c0_g1_i1:85-486(-)
MIKLQGAFGAQNIHTFVCLRPVLQGLSRLSLTAQTAGISLPVVLAAARTLRDSCRLWAQEWDDAGLPQPVVDEVADHLEAFVGEYEAHPLVADGLFDAATPSTSGPAGLAAAIKLYDPTATPASATTTPSSTS